MRPVLLATVLLLSMPVALLRAEDGPTLASRPPTADEVAAKLLSPSPASEALVEETIAGATPEFLRATLAAVRARLAPPPALPAPALSAPALPAPGGPPATAAHGDAATLPAHVVTFEIRILDMPPADAFTLLGCATDGGKPVVRPVSAADVEQILRSLNETSAVQLVTSAHVTTYDRQRATVEVLSKLAYIEDYLVESGTAHPIIGNVVEGITLELCPVLSPDLRSIRLALTTNVRRAVSPIEVEEISLPGSATPVEVQRPEVLTTGWSKTVTVANRGHTLIGGWPSKGDDGNERIRVVLIDATTSDLAGTPVPRLAPPLSPGVITPPVDAPTPPR